MAGKNDAVADALLNTLTSSTLSTRDMSPANVVDAIASLASEAGGIARAITPNAVGGRDANDGHVESLTEAVMGVTGGLCRIAEAINNLAEAVREHNDNS